MKVKKSLQNKVKGNKNHRIFRKYFNENIYIRNLWNRAEVMIRNRFVVSKAFLIRKKKKKQTENSTQAVRKRREL